MLRAYPVTKMGDEGNAVMVPIDDIVYVFRGDRVDRKDVLVSWPSVIRQALRKDAIYLRTSKMLYRLAKHTSMRNLIDWFAFRGVRMEEAVGGSVLFNIEVPFVTPDRNVTKRMMIGYRSGQDGDRPFEFLLLSRRCSTRLRRLLNE